MRVPRSYLSSVANVVLLYCLILAAQLLIFMFAEIGVHSGFDRDILHLVSEIIRKFRQTGICGFRFTV
jgi:hypothetical protein